MNLVYLVPFVALLGFVYIFFRSSWIMKQSEGEPKMKHISQLIANGAMAFLKAEYRVLAIFIVITAALLGGLSLTDANSSPLIMLAFVVGAVFSGTAGFIGMRVATRANVRTAQAARSSLSKALDISFAGGSVMGTGVVSLGILGLSLLFLLFNFLFNQGNTDADMMRVLNVLTGFSLGAESIALFARVGGGIYTKAADVGADLAGKVVAGIPEDDPRNPAVIADNVGDNVGDVAGMGADLFGSYVSTVLATMVLGVLVKAGTNDTGFAAVILPLLIAAVGTIFSMVSFFAVKVKEGGNPQGALNRGNVLAIILTAIASYFIITNVLPAECHEYKKMADGTLTEMHTYPSINIFYSVLIGLIVGGLISFITEFYCAMGRRPVMSIVRQSLSSPATNIIGGISVGMESTALPAIVLASGIIGSFLVGGLYGVAMAAAGMMATTGIQLAIDAFGPIADNAGGIAEMSGLPKEVRKNTDVLDAVGNTTAAIGKGFAIASAALTALALFAAFMEITGLQALDISNPWVLGGLLVGGMIPYLFSSLAISSVGRAANSMVLEVQRQFREIKGLLEGKEGVEADYAQCITISTQAAIREMMAPGLLAIFVPTFVGFVFGPEVLGGVLTGVLISGVLLAMFQSNAGGAWDNAKKSFEAGVKIGNDTYYKGSDVHKNSVVGDTVGDPFKDTSGPSMNILIKLTCIVALIIAPYIAKLHPVNHSQNLPVKPVIEQVEKG
ncbi:sodium-translocating pyrophosphatase [Sphingobacteriales bacterium UPWRP_1]|nr:sodium-translocating pyrophosphatase [Sphingobacteriales bacterium TSM_CSM]PSJ77437.1 sodium-translocating pyrophosphatase [Sphingobacteriales bacterium UPWRP_1]